MFIVEDLRLEKLEDEVRLSIVMPEKARELDRKSGRISDTLAAEYEYEEVPEGPEVPKDVKPEQTKSKANTDFLL